MKTLYLLRHAKSSWDHPGLADQQRPLSKRGLHDAPMMGERFASRDERLDQVLASPALRAFTTAQLFCEACGFAAEKIVAEPDLYFLGSGSIEGVIRAQDDRLQSLMLVFHNPDITYFANSLGDDVRIDNVPTSGLLKAQSDIESWSDWSPEGARAEYFDYPKNLSGEVITG